MIAQVWSRLFFQGSRVGINLGIVGWVGLIFPVQAEASPLLPLADTSAIVPLENTDHPEVAGNIQVNTQANIQANTQADPGQTAQSLVQAPVQITGVQVETTPQGLQLLLTTESGEFALPLTRTVGNALIAEIPNAVLVLPDAANFQQTDPIPGIALIQVVNLPGDRVRVAMTGSETAPIAEVRLASQQVILNVTPGSAVVTNPEDALQVVVTATRTEETLQNVPRSVTVITQAEIVEQARYSRNLTDILSRLIPGANSPTGSLYRFTLRGRDASVLIDGIPQNTNNFQTFTAPLTTIDPTEIERIEVVRGANSIYGSQATGGVINIITRRPSQDRLSHTIEAGTNAAAGGGDSFLLGDSFGYNLDYSVSGTAGSFEWLGSFSYANSGSFFDAAGERVGFEFNDSDSRTINGLIRLGVNLDDEQRLQFTFNQYDLERDSDFITDYSIADIEGIQTARLIEQPEGTQIIGTEDNLYFITTNATLSYSHDDLLNNRLQGQVFYRRFQSGGGYPFDDAFRGLIYSSFGETEQIGGRLQIETPFNAAETVSLLWGADYDHQTVFQNFNIFDREAFESSDGRIFRKIDEIEYIPRYQFSDLGIFAQLQWELFDRLTLSGGARYVNLSYDVDDYVSYDDRSIEGGTLNADDVVFNAGAIFNLTSAISLFTNFSQGYSFPDLSRVLREPPEGFVDLETSLAEITEPQKVNNYEIGLRGEWEDVQLSLAGFYNYSSSGVSLEFDADRGYNVIRAPQRVYGVEATIDWQPGSWSLGGTASWQEGENDADEDGEFLALDSLTIAPLKLTAYVENETLPGWRNRLQMLYSGGRDRAFNDAVDGAAIDSYVTFDFLSSVALGGGELILGIQNLLNADYFPVDSQYFAPIYDPSNYKAQGRTISLSYRITF